MARPEWSAMRFKNPPVPEHFLLEVASLPRPARLDELLGGPGPFELEIGSGKGTFLVAEAQARPDVRFLGIEYMKKYAAYAADRLRRAGLENARAIGHDAVEILREVIPAGSLQAVHVYFPDPWPKARHHKRRIVRADVLREFERVVEPGGTIRIVTDHPEYAEWIEDVLQTSEFPRIDYTPPLSAGEGELVGTNFERKYIVRDGRPFFPFCLRKPAA